MTDPSDVVVEARKALEGVTEGPWVWDFPERHGDDSLKSETATETYGTTRYPAEVLGAVWHNDDTAGIAISEANARFVAWCRTGVPALVAEVERLRALLPPIGVPGCGCHACYAKTHTWPDFMVVCRDCGCKRCPKATNHEHDCTRSNDSGQVGSCYGIPCDKPCCAQYEAERARERREFDNIFNPSGLDEFHPDTTHWKPELPPENRA